MEALSKLLYQYEGIIEVAFSSVSLLTMLVVIYLNYRANQNAKRAIEESKLIRELENRPYIYFYLEVRQGGGIVDFEMVNRGNGIARKINLSFDQELTITRNRKPVKHHDMALVKPISFLAPKKKFSEFVDIAHIFFQNNTEHPEITGKIEYEDASGKKYTTPIHVNLKGESSRRTMIPPTMNKLVSTVEQIQQVIARKR